MAGNPGSVKLNLSKYLHFMFSVLLGQFINQ